MECPRCGEELAAYALGPARASVCEACGYVGVPADHHASDSAHESWTDALIRFTGDPNTALPSVEHALTTLPCDRDDASADDNTADTDAGTSRRLGLARAPLQPFEVTLSAAVGRVDQADHTGEETNRSSVSEADE